jgi:UDP-N-acetylglucosamine 4,6-dehydratase
MTGEKMKDMFKDKSILITGGTGSFGRKFTEFVLKNYNLKKVIIFSRDEFKQSEMSKTFPEDKYPEIRFFLGDIRDRDRLLMAFNDVDYVIHSAALKQVPALEYNPFEAVKTNILGAQNIVDAAIERGVKKVIALSTDKAVNPINLYGGSKLDYI